MRTIAFFSLLLFSFILHSQEANDTTDSAQNIGTELAEIKRLLKEIQAQASESDTLAKVILVGNRVKDSKGDSHSVKSVEVYLQNGMFEKSRLYTTGGKIFESNKPLHLQQFKKFASKSPLRDVSVDSVTIKMRDLVWYVANLDNQNYSPEDGVYILTPTDTVAHLAVDTNLNSYLDYRLYSDLLGLLGDEGNGLIQTDISSTITYNSFPVAPGMYVFNYIKPTFKLSKFDSEFRAQVVPNEPQMIDLNRLQFNQLAFLELGITLNLFKVNLFQHSFDLLNFGADFKYSRVQFGETEETKTLNASALFIETRAQFMKYKNFGFELASQAYFQNIKDNEVIGSGEYYDYLKTEFSMFYHPNDKAQDKIFLRFQSFSDYLFNDFYTQLQFGYKSQLNFK